MQPAAQLCARATTGIRRLRLTTKMAGKGYYKGTGSGKMGEHTKHGGYKIDPERVRTYVVPDLTGFLLTPYVTLKMKPLRGRYKPGQHPMSGDCFLEQWKEVNGVN